MGIPSNDINFEEMATENIIVKKVTKSTLPDDCGIDCNLNCDDCLYKKESEEN